jgi:hypothetical protein
LVLCAIGAFDLTERRFALKVLGKGEESVNFCIWKQTHTQIRIFPMKKFFATLAMAAMGFLAQAQNNVGINTTPDASAALDVGFPTSTPKGMLVPRMSTAQRNAITAPAKGLMVFDSSLNNFYFHNGTAWTTVSGSSSGPAVQVHATATTAQTFTCYGLNRYSFNFNNTVGGAGSSAFTAGNAFTVSATTSGLYHINVNLLITAFNGYTNPHAVPEIEVNRGSSRFYYYGVGMYNGTFIGDGTNGTSIGTPGAPFSYGRGLADVYVPLQANDVVKIYFRLSASATSASYSVTFSNDGSSNVTFVKMN